jgi:hypothetical protein
VVVEEMEMAARELVRLDMSIEMEGLFVISA